MKWKCTVCGYIHEGVMPPQKCPVCGVGPEKFIPVPESGATDRFDDATKEEMQQLMFNISYGLYVVTTDYNGQRNGMISNSFIQVTSDPLRGSVCLNKGTYTGELIQQSKKFAVSILGQDNHELVSHFGFQTGHTVDKFSNQPYIEGDETKCPMIPSTLCAMEFEVEQIIDLGTHNLYIGKLVGGRSFAKGEPMTYAYYRNTR